MARTWPVKIVLAPFNILMNIVETVSKPAYVAVPATLRQHVRRRDFLFILIAMLPWWGQWLFTLGMDACSTCW